VPNASNPPPDKCLPFSSQKRRLAALKASVAPEAFSTFGFQGSRFLALAVFNAFRFAAIRTSSLERS
jgi:hypothetical protein